MELLDGKATARQIETELKTLLKPDLRPPHLVAVLVGEDAPSQIYVRNKMRACERVGIESTTLRLEAQITQTMLLETLAKLNVDPQVDGIIVQLPLPEQISPEAVLLQLSPEKDVDGFHPLNLGQMFRGQPSFLPATPAGVIELLKRYRIETAGRECVVVGRSLIVGRPVAHLLSVSGAGGNATVTLCHSRTRDLAAHTRRAEILVAAAGQPELIRGDMVSEGAVVVDVGIHRREGSDGKAQLVGDVHFGEVSPRCRYITPVPGGVGPMTIAMLLRNTVTAWQRHTGAENQP